MNFLYEAKQLFASVLLIKKAIVTFLFVIMFIFSCLFISWIYYINSIPQRHDWYLETFDDGIQRLEVLDGAYCAAAEDHTGVLKLERDVYAAPHAMHKLSLTQMSQDSFVFHMRIFVRDFSGNSVILGVLNIPTGQIALVVNKDNFLGISYNLFDEANYSTNIVSKLKKNHWQDIYLYYDSYKKIIYIYNGKNLASKVEYKVFTPPLQEMWLGAMWLGGGENYGAPLNILYDEVSISNEGILPKPSFIQYIINKINGI